jgi:itaconate CoA-transferase
LRVENSVALRAIIVEVFAALTRAEVLERLEAAQIANAAVNTMGDVWKHPQLAARDRWSQIDSPSGSLPALIPPGSSSAFDARMDKIPALGEHSAAILTELGYTSEALQGLKQQGVI